VKKVQWNKPNQYLFLFRLVMYFTVLAVLLWIPWKYIDGGPVICPFRGFFGIDCLGCGMTRAFWKIVHLHLNQAFRYNGLSFLLFPSCVFLIIRDIVGGIRNLF
jgi:hypothetical protein